jgi:hypothetical protein
MRCKALLQKRGKNPSRTAVSLPLRATTRSALSGDEPKDLCAKAHLGCHCPPQIESRIYMGQLPQLASGQSMGAPRVVYALLQAQTEDQTQEIKNNKLFSH